MSAAEAMLSLQFLAAAPSTKQQIATATFELQGWPTKLSLKTTSQDQGVRSGTEGQAPETELTAGAGGRSLQINAGHEHIRRKSEGKHVD